MKKLGLLLMLFTFAACTNDDFSVLQENEEITLPTAVTRASGDKLYDLLGYGYDVTGLYFTSASAERIMRKGSILALCLPIMLE